MKLISHYENYQTEQNVLRYNICSHYLKDIEITKHLDVGSFDGKSFNFIESKNKFAIEPSEFGKQELKRKKVRLLGSSIEEYNGNLKFDLITFFDVLEHLFDPLEALQKCYKLLNNKGFVCYTFPNDVYNLKNFSKLIFQSKKAPIFRYLNNGHIRFFSLATARQLSLDSGFHVNVSIGYGRWKVLNSLFPNQFSYGYFILAQKRI